MKGKTLLLRFSATIAITVIIALSFSMIIRYMGFSEFGNGIYTGILISFAVPPLKKRIDKKIK